MQLQMETCNLEECDFLETRFKEYETEGAFCVDVYDNDTLVPNVKILSCLIKMGNIKVLSYVLQIVMVSVRI